MFIELLQCSGEEESVCPYCHSYFNVEVMKSENRYYGPRFVTKNSFRCKCKTCEHLIFVDTVSEDTKDGYLWNKFIYVFADEWMQHQSVGDEVQYCTELNEVYINNIVTNEDELWLHQKYKEEYNPKTSRVEYNKAKTFHNRRWLAESFLRQRRLKKKYKTT